MTLCQDVLKMVAVQEGHQNTLPQALDAWKQSHLDPVGFYDQVGEIDATLFAYALYDILHHSREHRRLANAIMITFEHIHPSLEEIPYGSDKASQIIYDEKEKIGMSNPSKDFTKVDTATSERFHLLHRAYQGYILRQAEKYFEAFMILANRDKGQMSSCEL